MVNMWKKLLSPAKLNLGLWILGKRPDGYHEILTIFHEIDLCDEIYIKEGPLKVETSTGIPQEENLVYKGILEFGRRLGKIPEVSVYINKKIPEGSGLGGGSSNLATVLKEVNRMMGQPFDNEELKEIAGLVSSDAPFFIEGGTAIGRGRGEILEKVEDLDLSFTLIIPDVKAQTKMVYSSVGEKDFRSVDIYEVLERLKEGDYSLLENKLGEIACDLYPQIGEVVRFLEFLGEKPLVTGSGSGVFYINDPSPEVEKGCRLRGWKLFRVKSWHGA